ncbi:MULTISPECIES: antitoxin AF2212-like protein [unclassified Desulfurobacterium]|uniref:antitoxin AF2212-like protein n=1 Tax=unclassified Desulfurobacterium TaxID=2639089 RepID=UPI0003B3E5C6|nr:MULTISPECIES: antitoxin AF2212-like protein [unclassified Desulfurobacterium]
MKGKFKTAQVVYKNGVFVPVEDVEISEGTEAVVVFCEVPSFEEKPPWWNEVSGDENWKRALNGLVERIKEIVIPEELKLIDREGEREVIVILEGNETAFLKTLMEAGYHVYQTTGIFFPIQVISRKRLQRWQEFDREIFRLIQDGISLL